MITAIVLLQTERGQTEQTADALLAIPSVSEVYSVTGEWDLVALVRVRHYDQMAEVVPGRVSREPGVLRTQTMMAFQHFSRHDLERLWSIGMDQEVQVNP